MNHPAISVRETIRAKLQHIWGYDDFRSPQGEIVQCLLEQRDALIIMPTGGGKSICFQLPALMQPGLTIAVLVVCKSQIEPLMQNEVLHIRVLDQAS